MEDISPRILKRRQAVEAWKERNYDYYIMQKRILAHRPEYLEHRRNLYQTHVWSNDGPKIKVLGMGCSIVANVPTLCGSIFNLFRGP